MTLRERLTRAAELGLTVSLSPTEVRELLSDGAVLVSASIPTHDLTVAQLSARLGRPVSTVRAWVKAGHFGSSVYKLSARDWRVPVAAVDGFVKARRPVVVEPSEPLPVKRRRRRSTQGDAVDLSAWRRPT